MSANNNITTTSANTSAAPFAILFDMDGVITSNNEYHQQAWDFFCQEHGVHIEPEAFATKVFGKTNAEVVELLWPGKYNAAQQDAFAEEKEAIFRAIYKPHFQLTEGLQKFLDAMAGHGIPMAVATNAPRSNLSFTLDMGRLHKYFCGTVTPASVKLPKPAPDLYIAAAKLTGVIPAKCFVFEDSYGGIAAGCAAGATVIAIDSTYPAEDLKKLAHKVIHTFHDIDYHALMAMVPQIS